MPMIVEPVGANGVEVQKRAIAAMVERAKGGKVKLAQPKNRFKVPNVPEGFQDVWADPERLDSVYERGGEAVEATPENAARYRFMHEREVFRPFGMAISPVGTVEGERQQHPGFLMRGGLVMCLMSKEVLQAEDEAVVIETIVTRGTSVESFEGYTRAAEATKKAAGLGNKTSQGIHEIIEGNKSRVAEMTHLVQEANAEERSRPKPRAQRSGAKREGGGRQGGKSVNTVLASKGLSRADIIPANAERGEG